jgi:uracil-DNA glycosylase
MDDRLALANAWCRQQKELGMPDIFVQTGFDATAALQFLVYPRPQNAAPRFTPKKPAAPTPSRTAPAPGPKLLPVSHLMARAAKPAAAPIDKNDHVRNELVALYNAVKNCMECGLGAQRTKFVFGSGNPHAKLMIIGEAPGHDEDVQGLPFVGAAGELLTKMLAAVNVDRTRHVFIVNILKCRPPGNRNPESSEIIACRKILDRQIAIIRPQAVLLLGRTAAHALLNTTDSIGALRTTTHSVNGVPAFVTYHPASLLRNQSYKRPAWEDMQKLQKTLIELGIYDTEK